MRTKRYTDLYHKPSFTNVSVAIDVISHLINAIKHNAATFNVSLPLVWEEITTGKSINELTDYHHRLLLLLFYIRDDRKYATTEEIIQYQLEHDRIERAQNEQNKIWQTPKYNHKF